MPWLLYEPQTQQETIEDTSVQWKYVFAMDGSGDTASMLTFWLGQYSLEGAWLGWKRVTSELELCVSLGGGSFETPHSLDVSWRRFGSSLVTKCKIPMAKLLQCGMNPIYYDLFLENVGGSLVPIPVRILNLMKGQDRPNRNVNDGTENDVFVRRFTLCDAVLGKEGPPEAYFTTVQPRVFRWAAHMVMQVQTRPDTEAQIYVPILSIAYAESEVSNLEYDAVTTVSFRSEYSMDISSFWTWMTVFIVSLSTLVLGLSFYRVYFIIDRRYPSVEAKIDDPPLFAPRLVVMLLSFFTTSFSCLFWFHFTMTVYWFIMFKGQDTPHTLLPSALDGKEYEPHDIVMVIYACLAFFCVAIGLYKKCRLFVFLIDWEKGAPRSLQDEQEEERKNFNVYQSHTGAAHQQYPQYTQQLPQTGHYTQQNPQYTQQSVSFMSQHPQYTQQQPQQYNMMGSAQMIGTGTSGADTLGQFPQRTFNQDVFHRMAPQPLFQTQPQAQFGFSAGQGGHQFGSSGQVLLQDMPDRGVSAWRSLFIINELNERLTLTRTSSHITWLAMAALLEGYGWKNGARWYPSADGEDGILAAQYNPILQFALGTLVWLLIIFSQLLLRWISRKYFSDTLLEFVDLCSVANVSVLFLDEPFHGYYIHGKAPTGRGDYSHSELAKALDDEGKGIGLARGLTETNRTCQTYEVFLDSQLEVTIPGIGGGKHFRQELYDIFKDRNMLLQEMKSQRSSNHHQTLDDIMKLSSIRCKAQVLIDSLIHGVMAQARDVIQVQADVPAFCGAPPLQQHTCRHPIFYEDLDGVKWASCLAHGSESRLSYQGADKENRCSSPGVPTGFEWHLISFELIIFHLTWRFGGSIYLAVAFGFILNQLVLRTYAMIGRQMLSYTTVIHDKFLI